MDDLRLRPLTDKYRVKRFVSSFDAYSQVRALVPLKLKVRTVGIAIVGIRESRGKLAGNMKDFRGEMIMIVGGKIRRGA
jgi:hypothetical protein